MGYFDPLNTPCFKVACFDWNFIRGGRGSAAMRNSMHSPHPISLGGDAWASLVVLQPLSPLAFLWCVSVYNEHINCVFSDEYLEMSVVCAQ